MKRIIIYGCGKIGRNFILRQKNIQLISLAIDKRANNDSHTFCGIRLIKPSEYIHKDGDFIIFTLDIKYKKEIDEFVFEYQLEENKDYIFSRYWDNQIAIVYGNCHMNIMMEYLKGNFEFQKYDCYLYRIDLMDSDQKQLMIEDIKHAKVVIMQDIRANNKFNCLDVDLVKTYINKDCKLVIVPNVYGLNLFYPQIDLSKDGIYDEERDFFTVIGRGDTFIEYSFRQGKPIEWVINMIQSEIPIFNHVSEKFVSEINKLKRREIKCSITISDYILDNYRNIPLFYEPLHPTNHLIFEKCRRILKVLGIEAEKRIENIGIDDGLDQQEAFIYESVKNELGLNYKQSTIRNNGRNNLTKRGLNISQYVEQYYCAFNIQKSLKFDDLFYK